MWNGRKKLKRLLVHRSLSFSENATKPRIRMQMVFSFTGWFIASWIRFVLTGPVWRRGPHNGTPADISKLHSMPLHFNVTERKPTDRYVNTQEINYCARLLLPKGCHCETAFFALIFFVCFTCRWFSTRGFHRTRNSSFPALAQEMSCSFVLWNRNVGFASIGKVGQQSCAAWNRRFLRTFVV